MQFSIGREDPATPGVIALLEDGDAYGASLYPAESNHFLPLEALRADNVHFVVARDDQGTAVGTGALAMADGWAELKRMWVIPAARGQRAFQGDPGRTRGSCQGGRPYLAAARDRYRQSRGTGALRAHRV